MRVHLVLIILIIFSCIGIYYADNYVLKSLFFDESGRLLNSPNYKCRISVGKHFASNFIYNTNYKAVIGIGPFPISKSINGAQGNVDDNSIRISFSLSDCYPNPTTNFIRIRYSVPIETKVILQLLDIEGRIIKTLINEIQSPGIYNLTWDFRNIPSDLIPNGVYFYKIQAGEFSAVKKIIFVR